MSSAKASFPKVANVKKVKIFRLRIEPFQSQDVINLIVEM